MAAMAGKPRPVSATLPSPGAFSSTSPVTATQRASGLRPSAVLYSRERVQAVRARSEGFGQRRLAQTEEKKRLHREQMVSKSTLKDVSKISRARQGELAQELISKQDLLAKLDKEQIELDAMLQLSAVLLDRRSNELLDEKEAMVENLQRIQQVILKQQETLASVSEKKVRRNSITGSIKPQHRPSQRRRSSVTRGTGAEAPEPAPRPAGLTLASMASMTSSFESGGAKSAASTPRHAPPPTPPASRLRGSLLAKFGGHKNSPPPPPAPPPALGADNSAETKRVAFAAAPNKGSTVSKLFGGGEVEDTEWD